MEQPSYTSLLASPQEQCASVRDSDNEEVSFLVVALVACAGCVFFDVALSNLDVCGTS